jgi:hypothetical protein
MLGLIGLAQVQVKGYYRKNGTYVQPHVRSNPDGNPYNNYSFPGNTNPYTGKTATGSEEAYLNNYYKGSIGTQGSTYITGRTAPIPANFISQGTAKSIAPVRLFPRDNSDEIFKCKPGDIVFLLEDAGNAYYKVDINGFIGFLSRNFVEILNANNRNSETNITPYSTDNTSILANSTVKRPSTPPAKFIYETQIKVDTTASLRLSPRDNSDEIYRCKPGEKVYVLENAGNSYYKVEVHGFVGYLHRNCMP